MKRVIKNKALNVMLIMVGLIFIGPAGIARQSEDPAKLIAEMEQAVGNWDDLYALNDVQFDYNYEYPGQGTKDLSVEKYVFEGEKSWAKYAVHQINVAPNTPGEVIQYYDGTGAKVSQAGKELTDEASVGLAVFLRKANYFWFVMNFKLRDPGTVHKYLGDESVDDVKYDKISIGYESAVTGKPENDAYIIFINKETKLIDRFFFSLPAMGVKQPVILMEVDYTEYEGLKLPTTRRAYMPDPKTGKLSASPSIVQTSTNLKFNNGFTDEDMKM
ncbi:MAG: hypothetical protein AAFQ94_08920 [Bacteroidota bacterium]